MVCEVFMACPGKADDDHTTSIPKDGISLDLGPLLGFPHRQLQRVWASRVIECGLDTLGIICRRYRRFVAPVCRKWFSHRIRWFRIQLNKGFLQIPRELLVSLISLVALVVSPRIFDPGCRSHAVLLGLLLLALKSGCPLARVGRGTCTRPLMSTITTTLVSVVAPAGLLIPTTFVSVIAPISVVSVARMVLASRALVPTLTLWWGIWAWIRPLRLVARWVRGG